MKLIWTLGMALMAGITVHAEECAVMVRLGNSAAVPQTVLAQAKLVAGGIYAGIGVKLQWNATGSTAIDVRFEGLTGPQERPGSLAYTVLKVQGGSGVHVFYDRVDSLGGRSNTGILLGHVLAHEIAHVLEGAARHSDSGVLKAHWDLRDLQSMFSHPLRFALVDEALIQAAVAAANDLPTGRRSE